MARVLLPILGCVLTGSLGCSPDEGSRPGTDSDAGNGSANGQNGNGGSSGACPAPADSGQTALCLSLEVPEMQFEQDPELDGRGQLLVQVFDSPSPDEQGRAPLDVRVFPDQPPADSGAPLNEASILEIPTLRFEGLPQTVYVRAQFYDNPLTVGGLPLWGFWAGGADLSEPLSTNPDTGALEANLSLFPVELTVGSGTEASVELVPLRLLEVEVSLADGVIPADDGNGPLLAISYQGQTSDSTPTGVGAECVDVAAKPATVPMTVLGTGPHFLWASLNDFNVGADPAPGVLENAVTRNGVVTFPDSSQVQFQPDQYRLETTLELSQVGPVDSGNEPAPFSCPVGTP